MYYLEFDIHKDDSRVAVLDDDGEVVQEARVQNTSFERIAEEYAGSKAAIEATSNYYTIYDMLDEYLDVVVADPTQTKLLMTIPDVSFYSSLLITLELGAIDRFDEASEVVSYADLDPVVRESGDSRTEGSISKRGSGDLRWILVQCVQTAVHRCDDPYLGRFYARLKRRKNHQVAIVATARKLLVSIFYMLKCKEVYDPPGVNS